MRPEVLEAITWLDRQLREFGGVAPDARTNHAVRLVVDALQELRAPRQTEPARPSPSAP